MRSKVVFAQGSNNNKVSSDAGCTQKSARTLADCTADNVEYLARDAANNEFIREALNKSFSFMVRQAHHERNQYVTAHPEPAKGLNQRFLRESFQKAKGLSHHDTGSPELQFTGNRNL